MADSKLKLQIVTALDAAGIKATQEQIDTMENAITKANKNGGDGLTSLEKKLGKIPGPVGKIADVFEGLGGTVSKFGIAATSVIGAFKVGWDIGSWIYEKAVVPLFKIKDPIEEFKKEAKKADEQFNAMMSSIDEAADASARLQEKSSAALQKEIKEIDSASAAWQKAARNKIAYMTAGQDLETQMLERQRFEDVMRLQNEGDYEGAEQANKMYDIFEAQLKAKQELLRFDEETAAIQKQINDNDEKRTQLLYASLAAADALKAKIRERDEYEKKTDEIVMTNAQYKQYQRKARQYEREINRLKTAAEDAERTFQDYDIGSKELETRRLQRMAVVSRGTLAVDQAAYAYDQFTDTNGNPLGYVFTDQFKHTLEKNSIESYNNIEKAIKEGVAEGIGLLLEVK